MKKFFSLSFGILAVFALSLALEQRAMAYVDPGSGLLVLQSVGSAVAAAAYFMRKRILGFFKKSESTKAPAELAVGVKSDRKAA